MALAGAGTFHERRMEVRVTTQNQTGTSVEQKVMKIFQKVLSIEPTELKADAKLSEALGVDSTEMVEISVGIKKELGIAIADNELKKTHTFNEIVKIVKAKGAN